MPRVVRLATGLAAAAFALPAAAQTQNGATLYRQQCAACHALAPGSAKMGPSLNGVVGRKAATLPGYAFSPGLKAIGVTWDATSLDAYLAKPTTFAPGTKMIVGTASAAQRQAIIAYLAEQP